MKPQSTMTPDEVMGVLYQTRSYMPVVDRPKNFDEAMDYIRRAVNAHEELLEVLKYLLLAHRNSIVMGRDGNAIPPNPDAIRQAEQAIAKAEGL